MGAKDRIFVKGYGIFSFAKNMSQNVGKNVIIKLSGKYSQKILDHAKLSASDALTTAPKEQFKNSKSNW